MKDCKHMNFEAGTKVARLTDQDDSEKITGYSLDIIVNCKDCGLPFEFIGIPGGYSPAQPMVNFDSTEARMPIRPSTDPAEQLKAMQ
jgi:hypothetical protein